MCTPLSPLRRRMCCWEPVRDATLEVDNCIWDRSSSSYASNRTDFSGNPAIRWDSFPLSFALEYAKCGRSIKLFTMRRSPGLSSYLYWCGSSTLLDLGLQSKERIWDMQIKQWIYAGKLSRLAIDVIYDKKNTLSLLNLLVEDATQINLWFHYKLSD